MFISYNLSYRFQDWGIYINKLKKEKWLFLISIRLYKWCWYFWIKL